MCFDQSIGNPGTNGQTTKGLILKVLYNYKSNKYSQIEKFIRDLVLRYIMTKPCVKEL